MWKNRGSRSKYHNKKMEIDGHRFDSIKEAMHYKELKARLDAGEISDLMLQPKFELQEGFRYDGKAERAIYYVADFMYREDGKTIVVDVKGMKTDVYKIKRKLFLYKFPELVFREV